MDQSVTAIPPALDGEAIALQARDDRAAFATLYVRYRETVFRYLRARCTSDDDALELTAITFERAFVAIPRYSSRGGGVVAWLLRIARNAVIDAERRRRRHVQDDATDTASPEPTPEERVIGADDRTALRKLLVDLPQEQRDALALRYGAGLTAREIGLVINKSEAATQKLIRRAIGRLKEQMA